MEDQRDVKADRKGEAQTALSGSTLESHNRWHSWDTHPGSGTESPAGISTLLDSQVYTFVTKGQTRLLLWYYIKMDDRRLRNFKRKRIYLALDSVQGWKTVFSGVILAGNVQC